MFSYWAKPHHALECTWRSHDHRPTPCAPIAPLRRHRHGAAAVAIAGRARAGTLHGPARVAGCADRFAYRRRFRTTGFRTALEPGCAGTVRVLPGRQRPGRGDPGAPVGHEGNRHHAKYWLPWLVGMPAEQSRAACCLVFGGVLERLPKLKIALAHAAAASPTPSARIEHGFRCPGPGRHRQSAQPARVLKRCISIQGGRRSCFALPARCRRADRVMLGTDYPFPLGEQAPGAGIDALALGDADASRLYHGTALEWLGLTASRFA